MPHSSSHNRLNIAHRLFVYYVDENIFRNADGNMSRVSSEHLKILRLEELRHHCEKLGVPKSGNKGELISRLVTARISYDNLLVDDLKDILDNMNLPVSGNKSELIARIIGGGSSSARGASGGSSAADRQLFHSPMGMPGGIHPGWR